MLLDHFREKHGFAQVEDKDRGTVLRRVVFEGKIPIRGGMTIDSNAGLLSPVREILTKKAPINLQDCQLEDVPNNPLLRNGGELAKSNQCNIKEEAKREKRPQDGEEMNTNREDPFFESSGCDYASISEHELFKHVKCTHVKTDQADQSESSPGERDLDANHGTGLKKVVLQYSAGGEKPVEVSKEQATVNECRLCEFTAPKMQAILLVRHMREVHGETKGFEVERPMPHTNEYSNEDLNEFIQGPEESSAPPTIPTGHIQEEFVNRAPGVGGVYSENLIKHTMNYKCDLCDYVTNQKKDLKGHKSFIHEQEGRMFKCWLCDYSSSHSNDMKEHFSKFHPPPVEEVETTRMPDGLNKNVKTSVPREKMKKLVTRKNVKTSADKDDAKPKEKSRDQRDLCNAMERQRRVDQKIKFDILKDSVPKLRDVATASKVVILKEAAQYARHLGETSLTLARERERLAERNTELRRRLESAKSEYLEDDMEFIEAENDVGWVSNLGLLDDSGYSSPELTGLNEYLTPLTPIESALSMF